MKIKELEGKERTPITCYTCGTVYDKELGKGRRHKFIWDPLVGMVDYYFLLMDKIFDMPDRIKERIARKRKLKEMVKQNANI